MAQYFSARSIKVLRSDLHHKHDLMAESPFLFFRGTFYRWSQLTRGLAELASPQVMAVGDLHVENFGTWRDSEGRLIWGVNDFDEVAPHPYLCDVVRLMASAHLAARAAHLAIRPKRATQVIWEGYVDALHTGGNAFVLEEQHAFLRNIALARPREPVQFWNHLVCLPAASAVPDTALRTLREALPAVDLNVKFKRRRAGVGSLGRPRYVAIADWHGSLLAREAKALLPSATVWAHGIAPDATWMMKIVERAIRVPDPFMHVGDIWISRRLSPHCSRISLASLPVRRDEEGLLHAMGAETANIHLGTGRAVARVIRDAGKRRQRGIQDIVKTLVRATLKDWTEWCDFRKGK
jgi:hypothetical protein